MKSVCSWGIAGGKGEADLLTAAQASIPGKTAPGAAQGRLAFLFRTVITLQGQRTGEISQFKHLVMLPAGYHICFLSGPVAQIGHVTNPSPIEAQSRSKNER